MKYFAFLLNMRNRDADYIFQMGRLFQEFVIFGRMIIDNSRLMFQLTHQKEADHSSVLDFDSIYDNIGDDEEGDDQPRGENRIRPVTDLPTPMLSATLPSNVTLAPLLTAREAEVFVLKKRSVCFKILPPGCG